MKRGGVPARNYVLHISKSYTAARKDDAYYYIEEPKTPAGDKTWCGRMTAAVNCASTECAYSKDELCISCLGKASPCEEVTT